MKRILFALLLVVFSSSAFAVKKDGVAIVGDGNEGPYGGGGIVCGGGRGNNPVQATLLDLWEAQAFKKMAITPSSDPVNVQLQKALTNYAEINQWVPDEVRDTAWELYLEVELQKSNPVLAGLEIPPPTDVLVPFVPTKASGCQLKGIASYNDVRDLLSVDYSLYDAFLNTDKAALFTHESVYKYLRAHYHVQDSIAARNITACLFADEPCPELSPVYGIPKTGPMYLCHPDGWFEAAVEELDYDSQDNRTAEPWFYVFPTKSLRVKPLYNNTPWRFQQTMVKKEMTVVDKGFDYEQMPTVTFIDMQIGSPDTLTLDPQGHVVMPVLGSKGELDSIQSTYSSDTDPWRYVLGPRFNYRFRQSGPVSPGSKTPYLEINGFPLTCEKVR